jgi:glycolate oxidase FAD binding subunit
MTSGVERVTVRLGDLGDRLRLGRDEDAVDGIVPRFVAEPSSADDVASILSIANEEGIAVTPRGGGTKLGLGSVPDRVDLVLSMRSLNRLVEHASDDLTATIQAGCTIGALRSGLASRGQRLALDPPHADRATLGGVLASNDSGPLRTRFGSARNLILGVTVALVDGTIARSGGKVVKNVAGYDLPKLLTGSLGTLGVILEATIRLHPTPKEIRDVTFSFPTAIIAAECMSRIAVSQLAPTCVQIRASATGPIAVDVRLEGAPGVAETSAARLAPLATGGNRSDETAQWEALERVRFDANASLVLKVGLLPSAIGAFVDKARAIGEAEGCQLSLVIQSDGVGFVRFDGNADAFMRIVASVRSSAVYAIVFACPIGVKRGIDVWGSGQGAEPLMRRVKARFDPHGTLNPGRFVGGI